MMLGEKTDTLDSDGKIIKKVVDFSFEREEIDEVLKKLTGLIEQIPPMYSALKRDGKPLYEYARAGVTLERAARCVTMSLGRG